MSATKDYWTSKTVWTAYGVMLLGAAMSGLSKLVEESPMDSTIEGIIVMAIGFGMKELRKVTDQPVA